MPILNAKLTPITGPQVWAVLKRPKAGKAKGPDGWSPKELEALPEAWTDQLAAFYNQGEVEGHWPPAMLTKPTPETCDRRWAMRFSTMSLTWVMGREGELRAKLKMGASAGLTLL